MNREEIITILRDLHKISGFRVSLHGDDYREIAAYPETSHPFCALVHSDPVEHARCLACDRHECERAIKSQATHIYRCRHGLVEAVCPLYNFGVLTGFLMIGQVASDESERDELYKAALRISGDRRIAREASDSVPLIEESMVSSYVNIMTVCSQYITLSNAFPSKRVTVAELTKKYVNDHINGKIRIKDICASIGCSKSTLTSTFKRECGTTVNEYITNVRLDYAKKMLKEKEKNISEIAVLSGFSDQAYFSKVFSAKYGISPSQYRAKEINSEGKN